MTSLKHKDLWTTYVDITINAIKHGQYLRANKAVNSALSDAEDFRELDGRLVWLAHSLGEHFCEQGQYSDAEKLYALILEKREKILGPDHPDVADSLEKIAWMLVRTQGKEKTPNWIEVTCNLLGRYSQKLLVLRTAQESASAF